MAQAANPWDEVITNEQAQRLTGKIMKMLREIERLDQSKDLIEPYEIRGDCVGFVEGGPTNRPGIALTNDGLQVWWYKNGNVDWCHEATDPEPTEELLRKVIQANHINPSAVEELKSLLLA